MTESDLKNAIATLAQSGWMETGKKLHKIYKFKSFGDAFAFMSACVPEIEKRDHHPEWLNVYDKITVELTTHSAGGVTSKDTALATVMDKIAEKF